MTKIRTSVTDLFGKKINLPEVGKVDVSKDGTIDAELSAETAHALVSSKIGYSYENPEEMPEEEGSSDEGLDGLDLAALRKVAKDAKLPAGEWAKIKEVDKLRQYIQSKLDEASIEE